MFGLASRSAATDRAWNKSCPSMHSSIGAARYGALRGVQLCPCMARFERRASQASNWVSFAVPFGSDRQQLQGPEPIHFCWCLRQVQCEYGPNLKDEYEDQHNAQSCGLVPLTCARYKWRSSCTEHQFNQRANPSFKRTGLRPAA